MRILVVSDIHSNFAALKTVFKDAGDFDQVWCLGDIVGYGAEPNECIDLLRAQDTVALAGNHDLAVVGKINPNQFNSDAQAAVFLNRHRLTTDNRDWLETLSPMFTLTEHNVTLVHGSPRDPVWEYVGTPAAARQNLERIQTSWCLHGHTHIPWVFRKPTFEIGMFTDSLPVNKPIALNSDRLLLNPGSVGQPRDGDPRAAYAIIDLAAMTLTHRRVQYDVAATQQKMKQAQLPGGLIRRLRFGQ